jgi:NitT/TauT family transport system substrate-binding protein
MAVSKNITEYSMRNNWILLLILIVTILLIGCKDESGHPSKVVIVTLAGHPLNLIPTDIAIKQKIFQSKKVDVEFMYVKGGTDATLALISGSADFGVMSMEHLVKAAVKGKELKLVAAINQYPGFALIVAHRKGYAKIDSVIKLKKMRIATSTPGGALHITLTYILKKNNLKESDVTFVPLPLEGVVAAIKTGQVDAAMSLEPYITELIKRKKAYVLVDLRKGSIADSLYGGKYIQAGLVTRSDMIIARPSVVQSLVCAYDSALNWMNNKQPSEIVNTAYGADTINNPLKVEAFTNQKDLFPINTKIEIGAVQNVLNVMEEMGILPSQNQLMATDLYDDAFCNCSNGVHQSIENNNAENHSQSESLGFIITVVILCIATVIIVIVIIYRSRRHNILIVKKEEEKEEIKEEKK